MPAPTCPVHGYELELHQVTQGDLVLGYMFLCPLDEWGSIGGECTTCVEPMLEFVDMHFISEPNPLRDTWVICGGESGAGCRPFEWDWARDLRDQCKRANVPFWMKQGGGYPNSRHELSDIPVDLQIRELPYAK